MAIGAMCRVRFLVTNRCRLIRWGKCTLATGDGNNGDHVWELCAFSAFSVSPCIFRLEVYWERRGSWGLGAPCRGPPPSSQRAAASPGAFAGRFLTRAGRGHVRGGRAVWGAERGDQPVALATAPRRARWVPPPQLALHLGVLQRRHGNPVPACVPARTRETCRGVSPSRRAVRTQPALRDSAPHSWRQSVGTSRPHWSPGEHLHL